MMKLYRLPEFGRLPVCPNCFGVIAGNPNRCPHCDWKDEDPLCEIACTYWTEYKNKDMGMIEVMKEI